MLAIPALRASRVLLPFLALTSLVACSKSSPTEPTMTGGTMVAPSATISLTSSGLSTHAVTVAPGAAVMFTNNDSVSHEIASDPHPAHTQCPELNGPVLPAGASFTATMAGAPETCGFHDHLNPTNTALQGTIIVSR